MADTYNLCTRDSNIHIYYNILSVLEIIIITYFIIYCPIYFMTL